MKKYIPNILTSLRILLIPLIVYFGFTDKIPYLIILSIIISFTDTLDGYLARKWEAFSTLGAKLDVIADKAFAVALLIVLINFRITFLYLLIMEVIIGLLGLFLYLKKGIDNTLLAGKLKTWTLFVSLILGLIYYAFGILQITTTIIIVITFILQIFALGSYIKTYLLNNKKKK